MKKYIPSIITSGNLICGFAAIQMGDYYWSSILLLCSFFFDGIDGLVARALNVSSDFGKQMDSLSDVVSFGVAPAYLYYLMAPDKDSILCTYAPFLIVIAGTVRLAKFNISAPKKYFQGLPIPANALFYIGVVLAHHYNDEAFSNFFGNQTNYILTPIFLSALMLTFGLRMMAIKGLSKRWQDNIFHYILVIVVAFLLVFYSYSALMYAVLAYIFISIFHTLFSKLKELSLR